MQWATFFLFTSLDPEWSCFASKVLSSNLFSLCQREACKHGLLLVTATAVWGHRAIPVDAPENGQLHPGPVVLQAAAPFTKWAPASFQIITSFFPG